MSSRKILICVFFFAFTLSAEDIYKIDVIIIKFSDVKTDEKFLNNLNFIPESVKPLNHDKSFEAPKDFINETSELVAYIDTEFDASKENKNIVSKKDTNKVYDLYKYTDLESLDFLVGRLRWRKNIEILDTFSWYQPLSELDEFTYHFDLENNISFYLNFYQSRYLHLNIKGFEGKLNLNENINHFISEDRRIKDSEINYFDHPTMGFIVRVDKT